MTTPAQPAGDAYTELQAIILKWNDGKRPFSGFVNDLLAHEQQTVRDFAAAIIAGGPEKISSQEAEDRQLYGWNFVIDQYQAAVTTALEAFLGGVK